MVNVDTNIIAIRRNKSYLFNKQKRKEKINSDSIKKFYETDIIGMIELFCIENIFFSSLVNTQLAFIWIPTVVPFSSTCYSYEAEFTHGASKRKRSSSDLLILRLVSMLIVSTLYHIELEI